MKSKITNIQGDGNFKDLYVFELEMENGDCGRIYKKSDSSGLEIGDEINYEITEKGTVKIQRDFQANYPRSNNPEVQKSIIKQSCLKCAVEFVISKDGKSDEVIKLAEKFVDWVNEKKSEDAPF